MKLGAHVIYKYEQNQWRREGEEGGGCEVVRSHRAVTCRAGTLTRVCIFFNVRLIIIINHYLLTVQFIESYPRYIHCLFPSTLYTHKQLDSFFFTVYFFIHCPSRFEVHRSKIPLRLIKRNGQNKRTQSRGRLIRLIEVVLSKGTML